MWRVLRSPSLLASSDFAFADLDAPQANPAMSARWPSVARAIPLLAISATQGSSMNECLAPIPRQLRRPYSFFLNGSSLTCGGRWNRR
jgi:hypothetical protein